MTFKARVFFEDEAPRIGSGWRWVTYKIGRKWVRFTSIGDGGKARLPIKMLDTMRPIGAVQIAD